MSIIIVILAMFAGILVVFNIVSTFEVSQAGKAIGSNPVVTWMMKVCGRFWIVGRVVLHGIFLSALFLPFFLPAEWLSIAILTGVIVVCSLSIWRNYRAYWCHGP